MNKKLSNSNDGLFGPSQGARAVRSGSFGELSLEAAFKAHGINIVNDHPEFHYDSDIFERKDKILIRQFLIRPSHRIDYLFRDFAVDLRLAIECRNQMGPGTTDEKLHFVVNRLARAGFPYWLIVSGGAFRPMVTQATQVLIVDSNKRTNVQGRLIFNAAHYLQRAVEKLIDCGEIFEVAE
jgi:hypothetical protein